MTAAAPEGSGRAEPGAGGSAAETPHGDSVRSLQAIAASSLHRAIGLRTVLPLLGWARQHPALLEDTGNRCKRFIVGTFDALVDVEGVEAVAEALDDPELFASLVAESEDRRRRIRALRTPGRVLDRPSPTAVAPQPDAAADPAMQPGSWADGTAHTSQGKGLAGRQRAGFDPGSPATSAVRGPGDAGARSPAEDHSGNGTTNGGGDSSGITNSDRTSSRTSQGGGPPVINGHAQYPYSSLVTDVDWPPDVEQTKRELHLSDAEFEEVFRMKLGAFEKLPAWRRLQLKKAKRLF